MTTANPETTPSASKKGRSPSYPSLPLDVAVKRASEVYDAERRNAAPVAGIQRLWGYKVGTGPANMAVAALKKYGLLSDSGSGSNRVAQLTKLGFDITNHPDPDFRAQAIRTAALMPPIHRAIWEQYQESGLPSDATLRYELITNRAFTETGATEFIGQFRKTVAYANLDATASVDLEDDADESGDEPDPGEDERRHDGAAERRRRTGGGKPNVLTIPVPVIGGTPVVIEGQFPISEAAWTQFLAVLQAMKPGLVADDVDVAEA